MWLKKQKKTLTRCDNKNTIVPQRAVSVMLGISSSDEDGDNSEEDWEERFG